MSSNLDPTVVENFGDEWSRFDQSSLSERDRAAIWDDYFRIFPWDSLPDGAVGADIGCGSGRWALLVSERPVVLHCVDPAGEALAVARRNLAGRQNCRFHNASADSLPFEDASLDFAYSLGVLHHIPDTAAAMAACVRKLKPGAPFLVYLYYSFENRSAAFRLLWRASELFRWTISRLPRPLAHGVTNVIAALVYWPLSRLAGLGERLGADVGGWPLSFYRDKAFYVLATDSLDRFGTRLEHRFSRAEISAMMQAAGLGDIRFSETPPFWTAVGVRTA